MSNFPKRNASFNPNAYRSQAAYDAHQKALRVANDAPKADTSISFNENGHRSEVRVANGAPKPDNTSNPNIYRTQVRVVNNDAPKPSNFFNRNSYRAQAHAANKDFPKPNKTFNPNGYRGQIRPNNDYHQPGNAPTFKTSGYRSQAAQGAYKNPSPGHNGAPKKQSQMPHKRQAAQKAGTSSNNAENNTHEPYFMTDAEVRQWFREAEADYERDKKAGKYDSYVPAGGHIPDFSAFRKTFDSSKTKVTGLNGSMHAPKAKASEAAKPSQGSN